MPDGGRLRRPLQVERSAINAYSVAMATLNIRRLPDDVHARLRLRAARAGRSMEAEARAIIAAACAKEPEHLDPADLQAFVDHLYGDEKPAGVVDALIRERRREARAEAEAE
jgi:plasmid stability protein